MKIRNTLIALAAALALGGAQAATYTFSGQIETGPATGQTFSGSFSYEIGGLSNSAYELVDLDSWSLTVLGTTYTSAGASVAPQAAFWDGVFVGISAGYVAPSGNGVSLVDGFTDFGGAYLAYKITAGEGFGSYTVSAVPEPSTWALGLAGLGLVGGIARRRQRAAAAV